VERGDEQIVHAVARWFRKKNKIGNKKTNKEKKENNAFFVVVDRGNFGDNG